MNFFNFTVHFLNSLGYSLCCLLREYSRDRRIYRIAIDIVSNMNVIWVIWMPLSDGHYIIFRMKTQNL